MDDEKVAAKLASHDARLDSVEKDQTKDQENLSSLDKTVAEISANVKNIWKEQKKCNERLAILENESRQNDKQLKVIFITALISGVIGYVFSLL